ncbi:MAG: flagellar biosynthetic protein FliR [Myxococcaceae bacterium]|nr:flagellar biosynthetic protein FliR [Myxococcaceae bacterium]
MSGADAFFTVFAPHLAGVTLCALRLLPVTLMCPLLGGVALTTTVRLTLTLALAGAVHIHGADAPLAAAHDLAAFTTACASEVLLGTVIGFLSSLPFDAARMTGRFIDTFRGASAEVVLPLAGSREAASGELLHQLLIVGAIVSGAMSDFIRALWLSFRTLPIGTWSVSSFDPTPALSALSTAFAVSFIIGAPVACIALLVDAGLAAAARLAPKMSLHDMAASGRLMAGAVVLLLGVNALNTQLLNHLHTLPGHLAALVGAGP